MKKAAKKVNKPNAKRSTGKVSGHKKYSPIKKHFGTFLRVTPMFVHGMVAGAFIGIVIVVGFRMESNAQALSVNSARNCDSNAVIYCGALTTTELDQRYSNSGVSQIYSYFGISEQNVKGEGGLSIDAGDVFKNGNVEVNNKVVATNAITAGRENIAGSTQVTHDGVTFYKRAPSVSFLQNSISAFVFMSDGNFKFAILASCGNPVIATPVPQPKPKPIPTPTPTPKPTPKAPTPKRTPPAQLGIRRRHSRRTRRPRSTSISTRWTARVAISTTCRTRTC